MNFRNKAFAVAGVTLVSGLAGCAVDRNVDEGLRYKADRLEVCAPQAGSEACLELVESYVEPELMFMEMGYVATFNEQQILDRAYQLRADTDGVSREAGATSLFIYLFGGLIVSAVDSHRKNPQRY